MKLYLAAIAVLVATGILAALLGRYKAAPGRVALLGVFVAACLGLVPCLRALRFESVPDTLSIPWDIPGGAFFVGLDALSAVFALPILCIAPLCALYGVEYLRGASERKSLAGAWSFFNLLVASMLLVLIARNALLFLVAWEVMALASFFLVAFDDDKLEVRRAAWLYLVATHLGAAALLAMFVLLASAAGSFDFTDFGRGLTPPLASAIFMLALLGFGSKAGLVPLHVWLPEAHPAAPSHVSALMSALMIKTGIYGLIRVVLYLGTPPLWWGGVLVTCGIISAIGGIVFALAQHDLKRLLAYSSVENIGIIALAMGLGMIGWSKGLPLISILGFAAALLHVLNHSVFKSLLFLGAGVVLHAAETRDMNRLGGLLQRMPVCGTAFLTGAAAAPGLPPFNGFISELMIFLAAFEAVTSTDVAVFVSGMATIGGLALVSGLAAATFANAAGTIFLGMPRSEAAQRAHEPGWRMGLPLLMLGAATLGIGLCAPLLLSQLQGALRVMRPDFAADLAGLLQPAMASLRGIVTVSAVFLVLCFALALFRFLVLRGRHRTVATTWDCGYAVPTARMQYTAASFAQPLTALFDAILRRRRRGVRVAGLFPSPGAHASSTPDLALENLFRPIAVGIEQLFARLHWLQHGNIHLYILYIAATLLFLLIWKLR